MQFGRLYLGNAIIDVLCLGPLQEEYYLLLESPVIIPMVSTCVLDVVLLHMKVCVLLSVEALFLIKIFNSCDCGVIRCVKIVKRILAKK